jgi:hypothetical protein
VTFLDDIASREERAFCRLEKFPFVRTVGGRDDDNDEQRQNAHVLLNYSFIQSLYCGRQQQQLRWDDGRIGTAVVGPTTTITATFCQPKFQPGRHGYCSSAGIPHLARAWGFPIFHAVAPYAVYHVLSLSVWEKQPPWWDDGHAYHTTITTAYLYFFFVRPLSAWPMVDVPGLEK